MLLGVLQICPNGPAEPPTRTLSTVQEGEKNTDLGSSRLLNLTRFFSSNSRDDLQYNFLGITEYTATGGE